MKGAIKHRDEVYMAFEGSKLTKNDLPTSAFSIGVNEFEKTNIPKVHNLSDHVGVRAAVLDNERVTT